MPESFIQGPPNSTGLKARTRRRTIGGNDVEEQYVIPVTDRVASYRGTANTFRIVGIANAAIHNLAYLANTTGSAVKVAVHDLSISSDATALAATQAHYKVWRVTTSLPTGGVAATKWAYDSAQSSAANVGLFGAASADGTASAITWTLLATTPQFSEFAPKYATFVGWRPPEENHLIPLGQGPTILNAGEHLVIALATTATTGSPVTSHYVVRAAFEEFLVP